FELDDEVFDYGGGFDGETSETALQADGRVITTGDFTSYDGTTAPGIVRINQDGTLDQTFDVGTGFNGDVNSVVVQTDGKVVLGGAFTSYDGTSVGRIIRLNTDGSVDNSFGGGTRFTNGVVNSLALQADGKILVAGSFTSYNGSTANRIVRLNTNGTVDTSFATGSGFDGPADIVITLPIGIVLVQGSFTSYDGTSVSNLVELSEDGVYWSTYIPGTAFGNGPVEQLRLVMPGAKVLAGGSFTSFDGTSAAGIARINSSGSLDQSFVYGSGFNGPVYEVTLQPDGKTLVGGAFTSYNGTSANNIIRINTDGTVDNSFDY